MSQTYVSKFNQNYLEFKDDETMYLKKWLVIKRPFASGQEKLLRDCKRKTTAEIGFRV